MNGNISDVSKLHRENLDVASALREASRDGNRPVVQALLPIMRDLGTSM